MNKENIRLYEARTKVDIAQWDQYRAARNGLLAESLKRFPNDELARVNWFLDQVRGTRLEDLPSVLESVRAK
jgi:hypothetical protein